MGVARKARHGVSIIGVLALIVLNWAALLVGDRQTVMVINALFAVITVIVVGAIVVFNIRVG